MQTTDSPETCQLELLEASNKFVQGELTPDQLRAVEERCMPRYSVAMRNLVRCHNMPTDEHAERVMKVR